MPVGRKALMSFSSEPAARRVIGHRPGPNPIKEANLMIEHTHWLVRLSEYRKELEAAKAKAWPLGS